uniref:Claudin-11 n=1 Tax=Neolamprologus brichardi TaxID=32507 RepID=A0A3Q4H6Y9_NEOBR
MSQMRRQLLGTAASGVGWVGVIVATATNDWIRTCDYTKATCVRMDELSSRGLWAECVISPSLYHLCYYFGFILCVFTYVQTARALMICACLLGLPATLLILMSMACVRLQNDTSAVKKRRARVGGVLFIFMAVCSIISTVWFPIGANKEEDLMSFGFSLYSGWVGSALCLLGGIIILCCQGIDPGTPSRDDSFYYSGNRGTATLLDPPANHAKSARV